MKIPQQPPSFQDVLAETTALLQQPELLARVHTAGHPHWDKLRRQPQPEGITATAAWGVLKFMRSMRATVTPLVDTTGRPFTWTNDAELSPGLHQIDLWGGGHIGVSEPVLDVESKSQYYLSSLITEAITSSQLEGASTTREVAQDMLLTKRLPRDLSERMIFNNFRTMQRIGELKDEPLSAALVFEIHRIVTEETLAKPDAAGRLRRADEDIAVVDNDGQILHQPPPAEQLARRMEQLCRFANGETPKGFLHPVLRAVVVHFWLAWDHPFVDGNGRTARALFYWSMLRSRYWLFDYISISEVILSAPAKYGRAFLLTETDDNDLTYFMLYHLDVILKALENLRTFIADKTASLRSLDGLLRTAADRFNHRQRELLTHALRHPSQVYTIAEHQARQQVVYQTARTDLLGLDEAGLLVKSTAGNKLVFRPIAKLEAHLRRLGAHAG